MSDTNEQEWPEPQPEPEVEPTHEGPEGDAPDNGEGTEDDA